MTSQGYVCGFQAKSKVTSMSGMSSFFKATKLPNLTTNIQGSRLCHIPVQLETRTYLLILEEFEDKIGDNMAGNEDKGKSVDPEESLYIPTTSYTPHPSVLVGSASKASSKDVSNHFFDPP
ncbi:hypothetical protein PIB30_101967 [Stylosanthes scabra]|uniref:Uncharacterized protein n=1 Tax=Stylosanthes scabra TaxID=79078 RepID=A0ABU6X058_9FABA|nr:hypothetical protein [Stylosanthes scabra]